MAVSLHGREWSPEELSAEILKALRAIVAEGMIDRPEAAVITVPAYFNDAQRNSTRKAGELAGLRVERIINEPTAAALAYGLNSLKEETKVAVYDLGGGTFDLSILELNKGVFQVLATCGNTRLGGDDIDRVLMEHLAEQIGQAGGPIVAGDPALWARLAEAAEEAKARLSSETETAIELPFLTPGFSFKHLLTREQLERLAKPVGDRVQRQPAQPAQRSECVVVNQVFRVAERLDKIGDGRGRRLAQRRESGRAARPQQLACLGENRRELLARGAPAA